MVKYKFSQNTDFIYSRVPGIAWNILKNSREFFTFTCKNVAFYKKEPFKKQDFSRA